MLLMENTDKVWALEQAARYAQKYEKTKEENQKIQEQLFALQEALEQAQKEILYLSKLANTQQLYIEKLEGCQQAKPNNKGNILTINYLKVVKDDAC